MFMGGNNFGSWAGGGVTTMYADGANWHADNLPNEPKHSHLTNLHRTIASAADDLVALPAQLQGISLPWRASGNDSWANGQTNRNPIHTLHAIVDVFNGIYIAYSMYICLCVCISLYVYCL